ncbi:unnamed protein product [Penicillium bialowiezense]
MDKANFLPEFEDPVRQYLIAQIAKNEPRLKMRIPRPSFYALWFGDIERLVKWTSTDKEAMSFRRINLTQNLPSFDIPSVWTDEDQVYQAHDTSTTQPESVSDHGQARIGFQSESTGSISDQARASDQARSRDHNTCVLTTRRNPKLRTIRIIPGSLNGEISKELSFYTAWVRLRFYWTEEKVNEWRRQLEEGALINTEKIYNMITLDAQVQEYWDRGLIAFRPVRVNRDQTEMQIAFYWLSNKECLGNIWQHQSVSLELSAFERPRYEDPEGDKVIIHAETGKKICSGDVFTVRTDDKEHHPLPSFELLEMRWHLSRMAAMMGYEPYDESSDSDPDCECRCHRQ